MATLETYYSQMMFCYRRIKKKDQKIKSVTGIKFRNVKFKKTVRIKCSYDYILFELFLVKKICQE
jgi:hypothetical protein